MGMAKRLEQGVSMNRWVLILSVLLANAWGAAAETDEVRLRITPPATVMQGQLPPRVHVWRRQGEIYESQHRPSLTVQQVQELRRSLLESSPESAFLERLGVTAERCEKLTAGLDRICETHTNPQELPGLLKDYFLKEPVGAGTEEIEVTLTAKPAIVATARGRHRPLYLPWEVESEGRRVASYNPSVSRALAPLSETPRVWQASLLDWEDVWVGESEARRTKMVSHLAGHKTASGRLRYHVNGLGSLGSAAHLGVDVTPLSGPVDMFQWTVPLERGLPTVSWNDCLRLLALQRRAVERQSWIEEWKTMGSKRTLLGMSEIPRGDFDFPAFLMMLTEHHWVRVGFLILSQDGETCFINAVQGSPTKRAHWFDSLELPPGKWARIVEGRPLLDDKSR